MAASSPAPPLASVGLGGFSGAGARIAGQHLPALVFIPAMVAGMLLFQLVDRRRTTDRVRR